MNIEHRTSNNEFGQLKKATRIDLRNYQDQRRPFFLFKIDKAQRHQYWTFDVERSMFNVHNFFSRFDWAPAASVWADT
jgi:hypothetical protein